MAGERKLYELRMRRNLTLQEAADYIGIDKNTLCRYEQNMPANLRPQVMARICALYGVQPDIFREEEDGLGDWWFRILSPAEAAEAYSRLDDRARLRISRMIAQERGRTEVSGGKS